MESSTWQRTRDCVSKCRLIPCSWATRSGIVLSRLAPSAKNRRSSRRNPLLKLLCFEFENWERGPFLSMESVQDHPQA